MAVQSKAKWLLATSAEQSWKGVLRRHAQCLWSRLEKVLGAVAGSCLKAASVRAGSLELVGEGLGGCVDGAVLAGKSE